MLDRLESVSWRSREFSGRRQKGRNEFQLQCCRPSLWLVPKLWHQSGLWCYVININSDISKMAKSKTRKISYVKQTVIYSGIDQMIAKCSMQR